MSDDLKVRETLRDMARLSLLSNRISAVQEKNLKAFPKVFFDGVSIGTIDYDFSHAALVDTEEDKSKLKEQDPSLALKYKFNKVNTKHFRVSYHLKVDDSANGTHMDKRFNALERAVRTLFYSDVKVEVFFNDKKVFESKFNE